MLRIHAITLAKQLSLLKKHKDKC
ncbi:hypothetical protein CY0110_16732 [Crocosphaera chwakensis CCY0110]|uniref:Uncharacterized protein n=1 Tax=Crocosphaera chwakensis CCY0110 TaxID=391612 RepID=A3II28_9CHRO|nr:hypothetical protein CY0110_16732 [Crocosphaera chwakensis CCY0110]